MKTEEQMMNEEFMAKGYLEGKAEYEELAEAVKDHSANAPKQLENTIRQNISITQNLVSSTQNELISQTATEKSVEENVELAERRVNDNFDKLLKQIMKENESLRQRVEELSERSSIKHLGDDVKTAVTDGLKTMKQGLDTVKETATNGVKTIGNFFKNAFTSIKDAAGKAIQAGLSGIGAGCKKMHEAVDNLRSSCENEYKKVRETCLNIGISINGLKKAWNDRQFEKAQDKMLKYSEKSWELDEEKNKLESSLEDIKNR